MSPSLTTDGQSLPRIGLGRRTSSTRSPSPPTDRGCSPPEKKKRHRKQIIPNEFGLYSGVLLFLSPMAETMPGDPRLRASDADRERTAALLREHHAVGRLTAEEFEERLNKVFAAK